MFWALQLVIVLVPGAIFHLYAACKSINQECILQKPIYSVLYILSVLLRISLEVIAFWLQTRLFGFQVKPLYLCDAGSLGGKFTIVQCMVPEHLEKTIFLIAMYTFTVITMVLCVAEIFEIDHSFSDISTVNSMDTNKSVVRVGKQSRRREVAQYGNRGVLVSQLSSSLKWGQ